MPTAILHTLILTALLAQPEQPSQPRLVDQGFEDAGPLTTSLKLTPVDLRQPTGFDRVYEVKIPVGPYGQGGTKSVYVRSSGGLNAVFPQSVYTPTPYGVVAELPPGTVFHIGDLDLGVTPGITSSHSPSDAPPRLGTAAAPRPGRQALAAPGLRVDRSAFTQPSAVQSTMSREPTPLDTIFEGEAVRRDRVSTHLRRARLAESRKPADDANLPGIR